MRCIWCRGTGEVVRWGHDPHNLLGSALPPKEDPLEQELTTACVVALILARSPVEAEAVVYSLFHERVTSARVKEVMASMVD